MKYFFIAMTLFFTNLLILSCTPYTDKLVAIRKEGIIRIAVFDSNPPFGYVDSHTNKLVGYDVDIANALAKVLDVKLELRTTNPANRIPLLKSKKVDLIAANFTITDERLKEVDFSIPYFSTSQKFIARKGLLRTAEDINNLRIGADKGTVQEITLREHYPTAKVISYDDTPLAFIALRNGNVQAITQDDAKLIGLLDNIVNKQKEAFEISSFGITKEYQGLAVLKGEKNLLDAINMALIKLEQDGDAIKIYHRWFGSESKTLLPRGNFKFKLLDQKLKND